MENVQNSKENFIAAPFALESLLTLARCGAKNETAYDIKSPLNLPDNPKEIESIITSMVSTLKKNKHFRFLQANRIYLNQVYSIKSDFKKITSQYHIDIQNMDFSNTSQTKDNINKWVNSQTEGKIEEIDSNVDEASKIVLVSAVYFKGHWLKMFQRDSISKRNFYTTKTKSVQAEMMEKTGMYKYCESAELEAKIVEVPFEGKEVSMVIVLPNSTDGFPFLEERIDRVFLPPKFVEERVNVFIPKFKFVTQVSNLKRTLQHMGMKKAFTNEADFNGLVAEKNVVYISDILQKIHIDICEEDNEQSSTISKRIFILDFVFTLALNSFTQSNYVVTGSLYKNLASDNNDNLLVSPLSVQIILGLAQHGANADTAEEIRNSLRLSSNIREYENVIRMLVPPVKNKKNLHLRMANKIYVQQNFSINKDFQKLAKNVYQAVAENVNFADQNKAADSINKWAKNETDNKIQHLIEAERVGTDTTMVLASALLFRSKWLKPFQRAITSKENFYKDEESAEKVDTMQKVDFFNYFESKDLKAKFLELCFESDEISMIIALPDEKTGLTSLENQIAQVFSPPEFTNERVKVAIPKFQFEYKIYLKECLQKVGIKKAFTQEADFSKISDKKGGIFIGEVVQKTYIDLSEEGVEAAATTENGETPFMRFFKFQFFLFSGSCYIE
ncbi:Serpin domain containing protein [Asbolus verrucosus]|uniref:Serpin domain containing protein n=1 Tax=Asbolus verrucosus TaxID=1661398 RepID=A0A482VTZ2_ASBVE|nr:Serpin domain containing protein [Asbolus verrucosus]